MAVFRKSKEASKSDKTRLGKDSLYGLRWQAQRDIALHLQEVTAKAKAPSSLADSLCRRNPNSRTALNKLKAATQKERGIGTRKGHRC